jgi:lysophospholipase L1-like esterase
MRILALIVAAAFVGCASACLAADRWEKDMRAFEQQDRENGYHKGGIIFLGSSSVRGWKTLKEDFPDLDVINRGFGGSRISDSTRHFDRIITPHRPRLIVFYAGDNDIAGGRTPDQALKDFQQFVQKAQSSLPKVRIAFISVKPSPSRWRVAKQMSEANARIAAYTRRTPGLDFIDVWPAMLDSSGEPRKDIFLADMLHMNESGYKLWTAIVRPHLD